jgi:hypothetical protein
VKFMRVQLLTGSRWRILISGALGEDCVLSLDQPKKSAAARCLHCMDSNDT